MEETAGKNWGLDVFASDLDDLQEACLMNERAGGWDHVTLMVSQAKSCHFLILS